MNEFEKMALSNKELFEKLRKGNEKQKVMITLPETTLEELDKLSTQMHYTRSGAIKEAVDLWIQMITQVNMIREKEND